MTAFLEAPPPGVQVIQVTLLSPYGKQPLLPSLMERQLGREYVTKLDIFIISLVLALNIKKHISSLKFYVESPLLRVMAHTVHQHRNFLPNLVKSLC